MLGPYVYIGIAQMALYFLIMPSAMYLTIGSWKIRPRMAWWPLTPFCWMRFAGGIVLIELEQDDLNFGLVFAANVLLDLGLIFLIFCMVGQLRIVIQDNYDHRSDFKQIAIGLILSCIVATASLATGEGLSFFDVKLSGILILAGNSLFAVVLLIIVGLDLYFWRLRSKLIPSSRKVLRGSILAAPFLIVRNIFGILDIASEFQYRLALVVSSVYSSALIFPLVVLLTEFIMVLIVGFTGYSMRPDRGAAIVEGESAEQVAVSF